jgi:cysteine desulfurase / selenocysteine lyase
MSTASLSAVSNPHEPLDIAALRDEFPILDRPLPEGQKLVYLDNASTAQKPRCVTAKLVDVFDRCNANAHRSAHTLAIMVDAELDASRRTIARFLGVADPDEVIFTSGTTAGLNLIATGWARKHLRPGDEIVLSVMEHHANFVPWQQAALATGAALRFLPLTDDGRIDESRIDEVLGPQTRLVAITGMSNVLGTIPPLRLVAEKAHKLGAVVVVDGAQSVPHSVVSVLDPLVDFLAFSGHKLFGPTGIGVLYGRRERLEETDPLLFGGNMIRSVRAEKSEWADIPAKFEAGTLPIAEAVALGTAVEFAERLGMERVAAYEHELTRIAWEGLSAIPGLRILGPGLEHRGAILSFVVDDVNPQDLGALLDTKGIAVRVGHHCAMPLHESLGLAASARASFAPYNTVDEVAFFVEQTARAVARLRRRVDKAGPAPRE